MGLESFIARRIHFDKDVKSGVNVSKPAVRIAVAGVSLGLAVMIVAMAVITGFKQEIRSKLIGFGSHIQITDFNNNDTYETEPVVFPQGLQDSIAAIPGVSHCEKFCKKPAILKTDNDLYGAILKGVDNDYDWSFFAGNLVDGSLPLFDDALSNDILVSKTTASKLNLKTGDKVLAYFIKDDIRLRRFTICGIYETGLQQFDEYFIIGDLRHVQRLNAWDSSQYSGMEILVDDYDRLDDIAYDVFLMTANRLDDEGGSYYTRTIKQLQPQIFAWLDLLDLNVVVILVLMIIVAGFNMVSALLILILEKTNMIGLLKALGSRDTSVSRIFLIQASFLIGKGLLYGNLIGIGLCLIQYFSHIMPLDTELYFVDYVPVRILPSHLLLLNLLSAASALAVLLVPSRIVSKMSPAGVMRFE